MCGAETVGKLRRKLDAGILRSLCYLLLPAVKRVLESWSNISSNTFPTRRVSTCVGVLPVHLWVLLEELGTVVVTWHQHK